MREMRNSHRIPDENVRRRDHLGKLGVGARIILKLVLKKRNTTV
jgi:hypothetical protein